MSIVICQGSTSTTLMKNIACVTTGSAWPTIIVPGINSSGNQAEQPEGRSRRRKRADTERVEEVGDEPDDKLEDRRRRAAVAPVWQPRLVAILQRIASSRPLAASAPSSIGTRVTAGTL